MALSINTVNASNAECRVFTRKDGVLSAVAHDLQLRVTDWELTVDPATHAISGRFEASSLVVAGTMHGGRLDEAAPSPSDRETIRNTIINEVLHARKFPRIDFNSTRVEGEQIEGDLTLHGTTRPVRATVTRLGDDYRAEVILHQPDFGIKPYSAMFGTLKVKADVVVQVTIPKKCLPGVTDP